MKVKQQTEAEYVTIILRDSPTNYLCRVNWLIMKKQVFVTFALLLLSLVTACRSRQQVNNQTTDSATTAAPDPAVDYAPELITGRLADLGLTRDSHWRGINLGDDFAVVNEKEKGEPFESDAQHVGYTLEFQTLETADVLYYQQGGKVSAIAVDLYLNNRQSVANFQKELTTYFTTRYGKPKPANDGTVWNGPAGERVALNDVSKGKDFGLKINITPTQGATTASTK